MDEGSGVWAGLFLGAVSVLLLLLLPPPMFARFGLGSRDRHLARQAREFSGCCSEAFIRGSGGKVGGGGEWARDSVVQVGLPGVGGEGMLLFGFGRLLC